jgi:hypothetical protein
VLQYSVKQEVIKDGGKESTVPQEKYEFYLILLKSSSLCLHSSNLGTFWLKIEQVWPFEEISIFSNSGHLERRAGL